MSDSKRCEQPQQTVQIPLTQGLFATIEAAAKYHGEFAGDFR